MNRWLFLHLLFLVMKLCSVNSADPCLSYKSEDNYQRSTAYIVPIDSVSRTCDRPFETAWYRFTSKAGGMMPTKCPPERACGTKGPVWLIGTHPAKVDEEKMLQAAVHTAGNCEAKKWDVQVKKCAEDNSEFYIYYLHATPGCDMAYCAGKEKRCGDGEVSPTGFTPGCTSKYPKMNSFPVVSVSIKNKRLQFKCKINPEEVNQEAKYEVTWYQGTPEKAINQVDTLSNGEIEAFLQNTNRYGEKPLFCLGQEILCKVRSYYSDTPALKSQYRRSNELFAGFKISPKLLDLSERDKPQKIIVTNTVPIVCEDGTENCKVLVELGQTNTDNFIDYCTLSFKPGPAGQTKEIEVVAKRDFVDDGDQTMFLKLHIPDHIDPTDWNCYKNITDIKIKTTDVKTARCSSTGDPHVTTFDGLYYNHYLVGDYTLVESKARKFKMHVRTWRCGSVSFNCGIAVQEGDDVIVVDMCRDRVPRARFASTVEPQKGTTIERNNNGKSFLLNFPSGAFVRIICSRSHLDFHIQLPSDDYQNTEGLCGKFDGNRNNDLTSKSGQVFRTDRRRNGPRGFTESWKLTARDSLFYYRGGPKKCLASRSKSYCTCKETCCGKRTVNCDYEGYSQRPKYKQGFRGYKSLTFPGAEHCGRRKRRSFDDSSVVLPDDGDTAIYDYNPAAITPDEGRFPTPQGKTETQARTTCTTKIKESTIGKACLKIINGFDVQDYIDQCVIDVRVLDDFIVPVQSAVTNMANNCEEKTLREVKKYWKKDSEGKEAPPEDIGDSACLNDCNDNGECRNGTCICNNDFITDDCSMKKGQQPILIGIPNDGLCDIRRQDCVRTRVIGDYFLDGPTLQCKATEGEMRDSLSPKKIGNEVIEQGQLLSFREISCLLPKVPLVINGNPSYSSGKPTGAFYISISNDGVNFSKNETLMIVYDSKCMECTKEGERTCKWKKNSCKMSNYCFANGDPKPDDWCQVCDPDRSRTKFVERLDNKSPMFKDTATQYIFKGQEWKYELPAVDPEKQSLRYSFIGESHGMKISSAGILTWTPNELKEYSFKVEVEDPCGLTASKEFKIDVKNCSCEGQNGGKCVWNTPNTPGEHECICPDGCKGIRCTDPVDGRVCKIKVSPQTEDEDSSSNGAVIAIIIILLIIIIVLLVLGFFIIRSLKKENKEVNMKNIKSTISNAGKNARDMVIPNKNIKDDNKKMRSSIRVNLRPVSS